MHIDMKYLLNYIKHYYNGKKLRQSKINKKKNTKKPQGNPKGN